MGGHCQQDCPGSDCIYESSVDKAGATSRGWCGGNNAGIFPPACRPAAPNAAPSAAPNAAPTDEPTAAPPTDAPTTGPPTDEPTPAPSSATAVPTEGPTPATAAPTGVNGCATCDLVPCGYCQQDCPGSDCIYESSVDKVGATSR